MNTVMIIGKLDGTVKELYDGLSPLCAAHICPMEEPVIREMLRLLTPDAVVILLDDGDSQPEDVFFLLEREAHRPPLIAVGSVEMQGRLIRGRWLPNRRIVFLQRPVGTEDVVTCVRGSLPLEERQGSDGRKQILVVDDDPAFLRVMHRMLSGRWNVAVASSGPRAVVAVSKAKPDLILLDYDMPLVDGKLTFQILRSEHDTADIPVVFLTGLSDPGHVEKILALHPQGYLLKPPSEEKILRKLTDILGDP